MKIAVVDDWIKDRELLRDMVAEYGKEKRIEVEIHCFKNGERFLEACLRIQFDIVFLDIYMDGIDGMQVARILREQGSNCLIVFVTNSCAYAIEGYWVKAFHYLLKPYSKEEFGSIMGRCFTALDINTHSINIKAGRTIRQVFITDIYYVDMRKHYVQVHTERELIKSRMYFRDIAALLENKCFLQCYRNVMVNMDKIEKMKEQDFILKNRERVPIQRSRYNQVQQAFADYLFQKNKRKE